MRDNHFVMWTSTPDIIKIKMVHIRKIGGKTYRSFINDYGDIPVYVVNTITNKAEDVVNPRGRAYACRNRLKYRPNKKKNACHLSQI